MKYIILEKARAGLVARKVTVKGRGGTFQSIRWMRPGEEAPKERKKKKVEPEKRREKAEKPKHGLKIGGKIILGGKEMAITAMGRDGMTARGKDSTKYLVRHEDVEKTPREKLGKEEPKEKETREEKPKEKKTVEDKKFQAKTESREIVNRMGGVMKIFKQSEGMCGPASIRIAVSAFGKKFTEEQIAKLAKSTSAEGTDHNGIVEALKKAGMNVVEHHDFSESHAIEVLRNYTKAGNPIIVDWMKTKLQIGGDVKASEGMKPGEEGAKSKTDIRKEENEHYSVVNKVDNKNIYLLDPLESKEEKLPIKYFMERWMTTSEKTKRWFVVLEGASEEK